MAGKDSICLKIAVTAHRDLRHADSADIAAQLTVFFDRLQHALPNLPLVLITPLAAGGDTLAAQVATDMGIPLEIPLPMPLALYENDFNDLGQLTEFRRLYQLGEVLELPLVAGNSIDSIQHAGCDRDRQYAQVGTYISAHCQILLALWDGEPSTEPGGTATVVRHHIFDNAADQTDPANYAQLFAEKENDLVYHIHCPRLQPSDQRPSGNWLNRLGPLPGTDIPPDYLRAFKSMSEFRADLSKHHLKIARTPNSLMATLAMLQQPSLNRVNQVYVGADWLAIHYRKLVVTHLALTHWLAVFMGICFILYSEYDELSILLPTFLLFFFAVVLLSIHSSGKNWHRKYLDNRALAEGLRVQFYWCLADIEGSQSTASAYDNLMQKQDAELVWIRHIMRNVSTAGLINGGKLDQGLALAKRHWIGGLNGEGGQLSYFQSSASSREHKLRWTSLLARLALWCGISMAILLLFIDDYASDEIVTLVLVLMGMLPLAAGIREAYTFKKADKELTRQYRFMLKTFSKAHQKFAQAKDEQEQQLVLRALGELCLEEHSEWILLHRERPLQHSSI